MKYSENYEFSLPYKADNDPADIDVLSNNFELIDEILKNHEGFIGNNANVLEKNEVTLETSPSEIPLGFSVCFVDTGKFVDGIYEMGVLKSYNSGDENQLYQITQIWYGLDRPMQRKSYKQFESTSTTHIWEDWFEYAAVSDIEQEVVSALQQALGNKLDVSAPIDPSWEKWDDIRYNYGFNKNTQPIFNTVHGTLESDTMLSVRGGKGRWGWHNFEGWSPNELCRLTMLIGKNHETFGYIQTFSPNGLYADRNRWGWIKIGCDELNEGTDFSKNWTTCYTPITLAPQNAPISLPDYDLNPQFTSNAVPYGTMYFDEEQQRIMLYTKTGWNPIAFVGEGGGSGGGEEEFYEPIPSYRNGYYVEVETSKIVSAGSNGRLAAFRLNKNTNYTVTRSALSARFRIYLYYNTSLDDAIEKGAVGTLIAQDSSHTSLSTLSFTNTDFAMAVVMLSNRGDTTTTITAEIIE